MHNHARSSQGYYIQKKAVIAICTGSMGMYWDLLIFTCGDTQHWPIKKKKTEKASVTGDTTAWRGDWGGLQSGLQKQR